MTDIVERVRFTAIGDKVDVVFEEVDLDEIREAKAQEAAEMAQESVGSAYRSPITRQVALEAARIALSQNNIQLLNRGEQ